MNKQVSNNITSSKSSQSYARSRLIKDLHRIEKEAEDSIFASPNEDNILQWEAILFGPEDTMWEGGIFKLNIKFTDDYPNKAPHLKFTTKIFHPNVFNDGNICLDILDNNWSPVYDVLSVLLSLRSLLSEPNPNSPANAEAANLYKNDSNAYNIKVKECVEQSIEEND